MNNSEQAIIIFVRRAEAGKVKTRLAAAIGNVMAVAIYKKLLAHTQSITNGLAAHKFIFYTDAPEENDGWTGSDCTKMIQAAGELGEKMKDAFEIVFAGGYKKTVIIGSDCLELTTNIITEAFVSLDTTDAVIGPAKDGGYYLLGLKSNNSTIFENKSWSTEKVFAQTIADFDAEQLSYHLLPVLTDVDTIEDVPPELLAALSRYITHYK